MSPAMVEEGEPKTPEQYYTCAYKEAQAWAEAQPVRLADLIDLTTIYLETFITFSSPSIAPVVALWIVQTYCFEQFYYCGYLSIRSNDPGA